MRAGGARPSLRQRIFFTALATLLPVVACHIVSPSQYNLLSTDTPPVEPPHQAATPSARPDDSASINVASARDEIIYSDWLLGSDNACCSGVIEWDEFHENTQGYSKSYADIAACSFPMFIDLESGSMEGKVSGEGYFSEFDSARTQAQYSARVIESWVKPLPTLDGWHFGGVLQVYIVMDAARKGWIGDEQTWLEDSRSITLQVPFIGQTDQKGTFGGMYNWASRPEAPVRFEWTCKMCALPENFPPPPQPR